VSFGDEVGDELGVGLVTGLGASDDGSDRVTRSSFRRL
jgi:hypothetical protein